MAFGGFTDEFTGSPVETATVSYIELDPSDDTPIDLEWTFINPNTDYPFCNVINVITTPVGFAVVLPDATQASTGVTTTIINSGNQDVLVRNATPTTIATIEAGQQWQFTLTSNETVGGPWLPIQLGATTSTVNAASLIDPTSDVNTHVNKGGLNSFGAYLKQNMIPYTYSVGSAYTQSTGDRGNVLIWTSGTGTYTCLDAATLGSGYCFAVLNNSTVGAIITFVPASGDTINGSALPYQLFPGDSALFTSDGANTIYAYVSSRTSTIVANLIAVDLSDADPSDVSITLTDEQAAYSIQRYVNAYGSSPYPFVTINYPDTIIGEYIALNASPSNPILVQIDGESNSDYQFYIAPGNRLALFSDGNHLYTSSNILELPDGSASEPPLNFQEENGTGIFRRTSDGAIGLSVDLDAVLYVPNPSTGNITAVNNIETVGYTYFQDGFNIYTLMRAYA